jgi:hypothetical protein
MAQESKIIWLIVPSEDRAVVLRAAGSELVPWVVELTDETPLADAIATLLTEQEYEAQPILLAPRSVDVLSVTLPPDPSANRQAMIYELEEYVPIPAERFVADFLSHDQGRFAGVIDVERFLPLLDELAARRILIQAIVPLSVLVAQYVTQQPVTVEAGLRAVVWSYERETLFDDGRIDLFFLMPDGQPLSWQLLDRNPEPLRIALASEILARNLDVAVETLSLPDELRRVLATIPRVRIPTGVPVEETEFQLSLAVASQSEMILTRKKRPWWDFCRDALTMRGMDRVLGKSIRMMLWGSVALAAALCLVLFVRMLRYDSLAHRYRGEQETSFRAALPEQQLQSGFRNRLESEWTKMSAQRENTSDLPQRESVLIPLLSVLRSLPSNVRYRFPEIRFEQNAIRLDGQLQVHGDAELVATALEDGGFAVEPPSTQQTGSSGVSVRLSIVRRVGGDKR